MNAINSEIRLIEQEKTHAERIAEQLENRATVVAAAAAAGNLRLLSQNYVNNDEIHYDLSDVFIANEESQALSTHALSTHSTPRNSPQHDFLVTKYNTVCFFSVSLAYLFAFSLFVFF